MGNHCCGIQKKSHEEKRGNPFAIDNDVEVPKAKGHKSYVLKNPSGNKIEEFYLLGRELGRGEFGITYLCTDKTNGEVFACKSISKKKLKTSVDIEDIRREVEIMKKLPKHPNIVSLKDTYEDGDHVHLVMELCEGGELFDRIVSRGHYTERAAAAVTRTIVEVIQICHMHGVMHRDLKPENFLFADRKETAPLKAIDFGLSVFFKPGQRFDEIVGSPFYMAPEVLRRNYGSEVDVWSAGVVLYILLSGFPPFWAETEQGIAQAIIRSAVEFKREPWSKVSDKAKDLVKKMLNPNPKKRLTAQEVLDHPWLQNAKSAPNVSLGETLRARLKQFSMMNKLKKQALHVTSCFIKHTNDDIIAVPVILSCFSEYQVIAEHLSVDEVEDIREGFQLMDVGNKGKIDINELRVGLHKLGHHLPEADLLVLMEAGDVNKDGYIDSGEFVAVSVHLRKMSTDDHLLKAFEFFDKNKTGYIEIEELRDAFADEASEEVIDGIIQDVDTDKDGRISYEEFATMMKAGTDWRKASRQYSRERYNSLSSKLMKDGSLQTSNEQL